jgi:predicted CopG family antitoxin
MTRQIALSEKAYDRLKRQKLKDESFSDVVERLIDNQLKDPRAFFKAMQKLPWTMTPEEHLAMIEADRDASREIL